MNNIICGDSAEVLKTLEAGSVQCVVTSPPYYGLRDYGAEGQIGLEETPEAYVEKLVQVFREVRRVLADDGTLWLNLGDSYAGTTPGQGGKSEKQTTNTGSFFEINRAKDRTSKRWGGGKTPASGDVKPKDLFGIPWMVAFALRADGWYLRSDIIWAKPNPMPESVTDRPTKSHEYIFLLSKSAQYYYDAEAIMEPLAAASVSRLSQDVASQAGSTRGNGGAKSNGNMKAVYKNLLPDGQQPNSMHLRRADGLPDEEYPARNKRDVWTVTTKPYKEAHFATFPPDLIEPCILAGSRVGDIVLDPFNGSGTTGAVAIKHHRSYIGIELNPAYVELTNRRFSKVQPVLFAQVSS
jgi:DNA modification methylase